MTLATRLDDYILAAVKEANFDRMEDGALFATIPSLPGVIAVASTPSECLVELSNRLQRTICNYVEKGFPLPVIGGIDPSNRDDLLRAGLDPTAIAQSGEIFESEEELEAAFDRWDAEIDQGST